MKMITKEELLFIEKQLYNKARDIDVAIFNSLLDSDCSTFVLDCLMMYQNADGGFGSGLFIDDYNPNSSVYQTYEALRILDMVGFNIHCENPLYHQIINKACNFLMNKCSLTDGAWNPTCPSNEAYAHSEKMNYHDDFISIWGYFPTAPILGYILSSTNPTKAYYKKAVRLLGYAMSYFNNQETLKEEDFRAFSSLLKSLKRTDAFSKEVEILEQRLINEGKKMVLNHQLSPFLLPDNLDDELCKEKENALDGLIERRASHGLWEHLEGWGSDRFPEADTASLKWIGAETVNVLYLLNAYGRIEK